MHTHESVTSVHLLMLLLVQFAANVLQCRWFYRWINLLSGGGPHVDDVRGHRRAFIVELLPPQDQVVPVGRVVFDLPGTSCQGRTLPVSGRSPRRVTRLG